MPVWKKEKAFFALVYDIGSDMYVSFQVSCIRYFISPAWLCFLLCGLHYRADSCVMTETPPEDAGLHSNKVHHPRGIGIFLLIAFRVTGQALIASASVICLCTGDVYLDFGSLTVIKWASYVGGIVMPTYSGVKAGVPCPFPWQPWFSHVLWTLAVSDVGTWHQMSPLWNKVQRQQEFDFSGIIPRFFT